MTHFDDLAIEARLERLERQQRRWRGVAGVACLGLVAVALMGQKPAGRTVEAERFILRDAAGRTRAELSLNRDGAPALTCSDRDGFATWKTTGR